jgi:DNA repair exonuclease SbcCD ATPase subunit
MAQPSLDDSVERLEGFCTLLGQTTAMLARDAQVLESRGDSLEQTEAETRKRGEHVAERLAAELDELTQAQASVVEEAGRLTEVAQDVATSRLPTTGDSLEAGGTAFEQVLGHDRAEIDAHFLDLAEAGFTGLAAVVDRNEDVLARAAEGAGQALEHLERGLAEAGQQAEDARTETMAGLARAESALREAEGELEQQTAEDATLWTVQLPETVQAECASVGDPLEALYREWEVEVGVEGDELSEAVAGLLQGGADVVTNEAGQPLAAAAEQTERDALQLLSEQQDGLLPVLAEGEPASEAAAALVDDLVVAGQVVDVIDQMLKALQE